VTAAYGTALRAEQQVARDRFEQHLAEVVTEAGGPRMIPVSRFIVESTDELAWHQARAAGVTATKVAEAATPSGFAKALEPADPMDDNPYMQFGRDAEPIIAQQVKDEFGLMPNRWLVAGENPRYLATPDLLALDHQTIGEIKTVGERSAWAPGSVKAVPIKYRRQIQWQLLCTGAERALLAWNVRVDDGAGWFYLGHMEPFTLWIDRDEAMIADLVDVADRLIAAKELTHA
jgi:hypothetical protein